MDSVSEHISFPNGKDLQPQLESLILSAARKAVEEAIPLIMHRSKRLDTSIADSIVSKVQGELQDSLGRLREASESLCNRLESTEHLLDVILVDEGPEPIHIVRELRNRDVASLAELRDAMKQGWFKIARGLEWPEANELARKLSFWEADVLIVPAGIKVDPSKKKRR